MNDNSMNTKRTIREVCRYRKGRARGGEPPIICLRYLRMRHGLTLKELSDETGVTVNVICRLEAGNKNCRIWSIKALADYFVVPMHELLNVMEEEGNS